MESLINTLRSNNKNHLADILEEYFDSTIGEYSKKLLQHKPRCPLENELIDAYREEMQEREYPETLITDVLKELSNTRVLQTSPHTSLLPNPRMFCIDWLCTRGIASEQLYIVGSFSGVPFSNSSHGGRLKLEGREYNFVPASHQDALVYESPIFSKTIKQFEQLKDIINKPKAENAEPGTAFSQMQCRALHFHQPKNFERFSDWACANSEHLHIKALHSKIVYLDINKIITRYLLKILDKKDHPIYRLLFDTVWREQFTEHFGDMIHLFYGSYTSKKYQKQESLYFDGYDLSGNNLEIPLTPDELRSKLLNNTLCPATIITFTILSFLNDFKCLGSFKQIEYLTDFKEKWQASKLLGDVSHVQTKNLSTGQFPNFEGTSLEYLESEIKPVLPNPDTTTMKELWKPMYDIFIK